MLFGVKGEQAKLDWAAEMRPLLLESRHAAVVAGEPPC